MSGSESGILERLMELDKRAEALVEEARGELDETVSHIEGDTERFRRESVEKVEERIKAVREEEEKASKAELEKVAGRYRELAGELEKTYEERHKEWGEELFRRCVGK